jgi:CRISPR system Cascade subunit CasB
MTQEELSPIQQFVGRLQELDAGQRGRLKRGAGCTLAESRGVLGLFFRLLPAGVQPAQHEAYFLVATLYPLAEGGGTGDLGAALRRARLASNAPGLDRRVEILLDADEQQLPFRLRQAVRFLQSNRVRVDWTQLLADVLEWRRYGRSVQKRWARSYFAA